MSIHRGYSLAEAKSFSVLVPENHRHAVLVDVELGVSVKVSNTEGVSVIKVKTRALIDTGANRSCISTRLASACRLDYTELANMRSAQGLITVPIYDVDISLPGGIEFFDIEILEFIGGSDFDVIIGMDILSQGDIALTNANGEMLFSMRVPPAQNHVDFTK